MSKCEEINLEKTIYPEYNCVGHDKTLPLFCRLATPRRLPTLRFSPAARRHPSFPSSTLRFRTLFIRFDSSYLSRLTQVYCWLSRSRFPSTSSTLFMQSEPTAVSQHTPSVDSSQSSPHPIQHGNDFDAAAVSGLLHPEETRDCSARASPTPGTSDALLSDLSDIDSAPPSSPAQRVSEYENAGTPSKKKDDPGFQVSSFMGPSNLPLETLPNGMLESRTPHPNGTLD